MLAVLTISLNLCMCQYLAHLFPKFLVSWGFTGQCIYIRPTRFGGASSTLQQVHLKQEASSICACLEAVSMRAHYHIATLMLLRAQRLSLMRSKPQL